MHMRVFFAIIMCIFLEIPSLLDFWHTYIVTSRNSCIFSYIFAYFSVSFEYANIPIRSFELHKSFSEKMHIMAQYCVKLHIANFVHICTHIQIIIFAYICAFRQKLSHKNPVSTDDYMLEYPKCWKKIFWAYSERILEIYSIHIFWLLIISHFVTN